MNFRDRVKAITASTGTGSLLLESTPLGYRAIPQAFDSGMRFLYVIQNSTTGEWEIGLGTHVYSSGSTLVREVPLSGSSTSLPVSFGAGSKEVFVAHPALFSQSEATRTFGTGAGGDLNVTTLVTLTADAEYRNLTISGVSGAIRTNGFRLRVSGVCDLSSAIAGAIQSNGANGGNGAAGGTGTGGTAPSPPAGLRAGAGGQGGAGGAGGSGGGANATVPGSLAPANGGDSFVFSGNGGDAGANSGGGGGRSGQLTSGTRFGVEPLVGVNSGALAYMRGGQGGCGGGGGAGDGTSGGGGGAGGNGGDTLDLAFAILKVGPGTASSAILAGGGQGGAGGAGGAGNRGGGGGGAGGGGGYCHLVVGAVVGGPKPDLIACPGGNGGAGGSKTGTGVNGDGGGGASGGRIQVIDLSTGSYTETVGAAGTAGSGATGGIGGFCSGGV